MPWLPTYDQGRVPADYTAAAGMSVQGRNPIDRRNQLLDALRTAAPQLFEALKSRRNDEIANALMNQMQPPRAESVDPSLQGAPATRPFKGGAEGFKAFQLYEKHLQDEEDRALNRQYRTAQIGNLHRKGEEGVPIDIGGQKYRVTPNAALEHYDRSLRRDKGDEKDVISKHGLTVADLDTPNLIKYYRKEGSGDGATNIPVSGDEAAKNPAGVFANIPGSNDLIPLEQWNAMAASFRAKHQPKVMGRPTDAAKVQDSVPILDEARKAIQGGKDPEAVKARLREMGVDPAGL